MDTGTGDFSLEVSCTLFVIVGRSTNGFEISHSCIQNGAEFYATLKAQGILKNEYLFSVLENTYLRVRRNVINHSSMGLILETAISIIRVFLF